MIKIIDKQSGRLFVVGDIHGCFSLLETKLKLVNFNEEEDTLISVGDLVDRGPESNKALEWLQKPFFHALFGNHEEMLHPYHIGSRWHIMNGGSWVTEESPAFHAEMWNVVADLPLMIEVHFNGKTFGFVHASINGARDWNVAKSFASEFDKFDEHPYCWDRLDVKEAQLVAKGTPRIDWDFNVANVDHVFFGHTPVKEPMTIGNCTWLDTGAFATNVLTVREIT